MKVRLGIPVYIFIKVFVEGAMLVGENKKYLLIAIDWFIAQIILNTQSK